MVYTHQLSREGDPNNDLFTLRMLKRFGMSLQILKKIYSCTTESILTGYITAWYGNCSAFDLKTLQRVVRTTQYRPLTFFSPY
jgi:hypothetical protein